MNKLKIILVVVLVLLVGSVFLGVKYFSIVKELRQARTALQTETINEKILEFSAFFINEVLDAKTEVSFDTRLELETAVRDLDDEEILNQWQKFIDSKTEIQAQEEVKNLLAMLVDKIRIQ